MLLEERTEHAITESEAEKFARALYGLDVTAKALPGAIYGILLIGLMYVMPGGVAGTLRAAPRFFSRLFSRAKHG